MFYKLEFEMERIDEAIKEGTNTIYAEKSNLREIEYPNIKKGFFRNFIYATKGEVVESWPDVMFYYSSKASSLESEYLLNVNSWPIVHKKVQEEFDKNNIKGIQYLPIKLLDVVTDEINENYVVMNILNYIEGIDLEKSEYSYDAEYDSYGFLPHKTYLNKDVCQEYDVFRVTKNSTAIYVSQKIKDIVEKNQWIGFEFYQEQTN